MSILKRLFHYNKALRVALEQKDLTQPHTVSFREHLHAQALTAQTHDEIRRVELILGAQPKPRMLWCEYVEHLRKLCAGNNGLLVIVSDKTRKEALIEVLRQD